MLVAMTLPVEYWTAAWKAATADIMLRCYLATDRDWFLGGRKITVDNSLWAQLFESGRGVIMLGIYSILIHWHHETQNSKNWRKRWNRNSPDLIRHCRHCGKKNQHCRCQHPIKNNRKGPAQQEEQLHTSESAVSNLETCRSQSNCSSGVCHPHLRF